MSTSPIRIESLHIYPIKSCGGASLAESLLIETGLELDRAWMVVDSEGEFVSQREFPRMALVVPTVKQSEVVLRAPGMLTLHVPAESAEGAVKVRVWSDECAAFDMGAVAAQWFSDFLGVKGLRLVRFDPEHKRPSDTKWTGGVEALNGFSDGFPILVASDASLADVNTKLAAAGHAAVGMNRFRPNVVLSGLDAFGEDYLDTLTFAAGTDGEVLLKLVKPCPRCPIPNLNPATGESSPEVGDVLSAYRANARVNGAVTFGMNAIVLRGVDAGLRVGDEGVAELRFE
jgi:uncharacterized protein